MQPFEQSLAQGTLRQRLLCLVLFIVLLTTISFSSSVFAEPTEQNQVPESPLTLHPHKATYSAKIKKGLSINGTALRELSLQNGGWNYRFDVDSMMAKIDESLSFKAEASKLRPLKYRYDLSGFFIKNRHQSANFDWTNKTISGKRNKDKWQLALDNHPLDRLGYQLQLASDVYSGQQEMSYQVVNKGRIETNRFAVTGEEQLDTALGSMPSIVVKKVRAEGKKRETFLWFSKDYPLLLLKLTQKEKDGEEYEVNIQELIHYHQPSANQVHPTVNKH